MNLLRIRSEGRAEVTPVELLFDLVFVIGITQISHTLHNHLTWPGALEAAILLTAMWILWEGAAWMTNWLDPGRLPVRAALFALMGVSLLMTSSLSEAFGERAQAFAIAVALFQVGRALFCVWALRSAGPLSRNIVRVLVWAIASGLFWAAGGFFDGGLRLGLWLTALAIDFLGPIALYRVPGLGRSETSDWAVEGGHMAERTGLFVLMALGESVLSTGLGFTELEWTPAVVAATAVTLIQAIAMWAIYFSRHAGLASGAIVSSADPGRVARRAFTYVPLIFIAGIIVCAVGAELTLAHPTGSADAATALVLVGGPALYLFGSALFTALLFRGGAAIRIAGLAATTALLFVAASLSPLWLSILTTLVLVAVAAGEAAWFSRHPNAAELLSANKQN